ncbi:hypothetical protein BC830DRAFT_723567 [Chytriomyces sp. MP71]|nr:hypothetical protein BC830DRAFT_723567 [Chytriomyces sp. MP71]
MSGFRFPSFPSGADFSVAPLTPEVVANTGIPEPTVSDKNATPLTKALLVWLLILPIAYFIFMIVGFASVYGSGAYGIVWFLFSGGLNAFMYFAIQRVVPAWVAVFVYAQAVIFGIQLLWSIIAIIGVFGILSWLAGVSAVFVLSLRSCRSRGSTCHCPSDSSWTGHCR